MLERKKAFEKLSDAGLKSTIDTNSTNAKREAAARYAAGAFGSTNSTVANMARELVKKAKDENAQGKNILKALKAEIAKSEKKGPEKKEEGGEKKGDGH